MASESERMQRRHLSSRPTSQPAGVIGSVRRWHMSKLLGVDRQALSGLARDGRGAAMTSSYEHQMDMVHQQELTIVIPTLDSAVWLPQVLRSHRDSFPDAEIVVVDDGSRDGTADLLESEAVYRPRFTVIRNPRRLGQWRATVLGCLAASSPMVLTIDDDAITSVSAIAKASGEIDRGADVVYLQTERRFETKWRSVGSILFRALARMRGFPPEYACATSTRLFQVDALRGAGSVPLDVHFARLGLTVASVDGSVEKIPDSATRYSIARLVAHGYVHIRPTRRVKD